MNNKILILDIETTGFLNQGGSIVEIGIVDLDIETGEISEVFNSLVREDILTAKHREEPLGWIFRNSDLTVEELREAPSAAEVFPKVQNILDSYPLGCTAYNNQFDFGFLRDRGLKIKSLPDPMKIATDVCKIPSNNGYPGYKWPTAEEAFRHFYPDIQYTEAHRGLDDAKHEAMIVFRLIQDGLFNIQIDSLQKNVDTVIANLQSIKITDQESLDEANRLLVACKQTVKTVEECYNDALKAAQDKKREAEKERIAVVKEIDKYRGPLTKAEHMVKQQMSAYLTEQDRICREEERKRREEEEDRRLNAAIEIGREEVLDKPIAVVKADEPELAKGTYTIDVWKFEITDKTKINPEFIIPDEKAIGQVVRSMKERAQAIVGEGVRVYSEKDIRSRT